MSHRETATEPKALQINLDLSNYGTFAEIGAGQEVARWFFRAGSASGTVAKTISAYDMKFSDAIYGPASRYVSRDRILTMVDYEYDLLEERLSGARGESTSFFAFANTVASRSHTKRQDGAAWLGIKFQDQPQNEPNRILLHARLLDKDNILKQEALGILGVNLTYAALYHAQDTDSLIESLGDQLSIDRLDVNMIELLGPAFANIDNRLMNLKLIQANLTHGIMFNANSHIVEPGEILYKKPILVQRGTFRPFTHVHQDMLTSSIKKFSQDIDSDDTAGIVPLMEITTNNLREADIFEPEDFLSRLDMLSELGKPVLISNYSEFYRLEDYFNRYSDKNIIFTIGVDILAEVLKEKYYENLDGGILESFGRLFKNQVKLYIYPARDPVTGEINTAENLKVPKHLRSLYNYLLENEFIVPLQGFCEEHFSIVSIEALEGIQAGDEQWEAMVPGPVAHIIKERGLFGYHAA